MADDNLIRSLDDIFNDPDVDDMLQAPVKQKSVTYDLEVTGFQEINEWVSDHDGQEPQKLRDPSQMKQRKLASRLKGIRESAERRDHLATYDTFGLLRDEPETEKLEDVIKQEKTDFSSLDDILNDDSVLFTGTQTQVSDSKLFDTKVYKDIQREQENRPEVVSQRKAMANLNQCLRRLKLRLHPVSASYGLSKTTKFYAIIFTC